MNIIQKIKQILHIGNKIKPFSKLQRGDKIYSLYIPNIRPSFMHGFFNSMLVEITMAQGEIYHMGGERKGKYVILAFEQKRLTGDAIWGLHVEEVYDAGYKYLLPHNVGENKNKRIFQFNTHAGILYIATNKQDLNKILKTALIALKNLIKQELDKKNNMVNYKDIKQYRVKSIKLIHQLKTL